MLYFDKNCHKHLVKILNLSAELCSLNHRVITWMFCLLFYTVDSYIWSIWPYYTTIPPQKLNSVKIAGVGVTVVDVTLKLTSILHFFNFFEMIDNIL